MVNLVACINQKYPNARQSVSKEPGTFLVEDDGTGAKIVFWDIKDEQGNPMPQPTEEEFQTIWQNYLTYQDSIKYRELRAKEYPAIGDQLDALLKDITPTSGSELEVIKNRWLAVKAEYPKP